MTTEETTGTGSGTAETAGAATTQAGEGVGNTSTEETQTPELGAATRIAMKKLERENQALQQKLDAKAEAEKTEAQKAIDDAVKAATATVEAKYATQATAFAVQRELLSKGVSKEAVEDLAGLVVTKHPGIEAEDIPAAVDAQIKAFGISTRAIASAPGTGGSPSGPPVKDNPWTKTGWNLSQQWALEKKDPAMAAKMAASAGVSLGAIKPIG